eukprot:4206013-Ditylum_brightwellii.AAC.1
MNLPLIPEISNSGNHKYCSIPAPWRMAPSQTLPTPKSFLQYCKKLQLWEHRLLINVEFLLDQEDIDDILQDDISLYFVTDRGAVDGAGYFGWVIDTALEILVRNKGHATGEPTDMESLRTKSISALSLLIFVCHYHQYKQLKLNADNRIHFCDNKTSVRRLQWHQLRHILNPSSTTGSDWDVQL